MSPPRSHLAAIHGSISPLRFMLEASPFPEKEREQLLVQKVAGSRV